MQVLLVISSILLATAVAAGYIAEALLDEITNLPGKPEEANFRHFSGFVGVGGRKQMFYTYIESEVNPETAPLLLWTNGGPGCSGLSGFFTEQGPFRPQKDGTLATNEYSWNKFANMVFIEQPVGVGFSTTGGDAIRYGDAQAAADNYNFILGFFKKYPNLAGNAFYITSESYGGHYLPQLAKVIVDKGGVDNFRGLAVGNPFTFIAYANYGELATFAGHNLVPKPLWDSFIKQGCDKVTSPNYSGDCRTIQRKIRSITSGLDNYALDYPICTVRSEEDTVHLFHRSRAQRYAMMTEMAPLLRRDDLIVSDASDDEVAYFPPSYDPCVDSYAATYLNRADVRIALHIPTTFTKKWGSCANIDYSEADINTSMVPVWEYLTSGGFGLDLLIYSGDDDTVCATAGTQLFLWGTGWAVEADWAPWYAGSQVGGFLTEFNNQKDVKRKGVVKFATIHGAGHMTPNTRPAQTSLLLQRFLDGKL